MTVMLVVVCDSCGKWQAAEEADPWGHYDRQSGYRREQSDDPDDPTLDLCPECDNYDRRGALIWGPEE